MDEIQPIIPSPFPFDVNDKIFSCTDDEGNIIGEPYSYNDFIQEIKDISGINEELLGIDLETIEADYAESWQHMHKLWKETKYDVKLKEK